jgi:hypothetical protein
MAGEVAEARISKNGSPDSSWRRREILLAARLYCGGCCMSRTCRVRRVGARHKGSVCSGADSAFGGQGSEGSPTSRPGTRSNWAGRERIAPRPQQGSGASANSCDEISLAAKITLCSAGSFTPRRPNSARDAVTSRAPMLWQTITTSAGDSSAMVREDRMTRPWAFMQRRMGSWLPAQNRDRCRAGAAAQ